MCSAEIYRLNRLWCILNYQDSQMLIKIDIQTLNDILKRYESVSPKINEVTASAIIWSIAYQWLSLYLYIFLSLSNVMNMEIFIFSLQCNEYGNFSQRAVHQYSIHIFNTLLIFSENVTTSDGYRWGYVRFAHFLLYFISRLLRYPVTPSIYWVNVRPRETTLNVIDVQKPYQNQNMTRMLLKKLVIVSAAPSTLPLYTNGFYLFGLMQ